MNDNTLTVYIKRLREKIEQDRRSFSIRDSAWDGVISWENRRRYELSEKYRAALSAPFFSRSVADSLLSVFSFWKGRELFFFSFQGTELLLIFVWLFFSARRYRRLKDLAYHSGFRLLHGERQIRLEEYREGELEVLANELQKLLSRLSGQSDRLQQEKRYLSDSLADISHQLRTPLTSLNLIFARLSEEGEERERRRLVCEAKRLLERTSWLVETLLKISRIDAGTGCF